MCSTSSSRFRRLAKETTPQRLTVLDALSEFEKVNGYPPTVRELSQQVGSATSTVHAHLESLERHGLAYRSCRSVRGWRPTRDAGRAA